MAWSPSDEGATPLTIKPEFLDTLAKLETAGGAKTIKGPNGEDSNNLFNIKGPGFRAKDKVEGSNDTYRTYASPEESKDDLTSLLVRKYPAALKAETAEQFATALKSGGYATDVDYVKKFVNIAGKSKAWDPASAGAIPAQGTAAPVEKAWDPASAGAVPAATSRTPVELTPYKETSVGSKAESGLRGAIQGATAGFGDEIGSFIRAYSPVQLDARVDANGRTSPVLGLNKDFGEYTKLRDEQRAANTASSNANPLLYGTGEIAASAPQFLAGGATKTVLGAAARSGAIQGAAGFGGAEGSMADQGREALKQGLVGAVAGAGGKAISNLGGAIKSAATENFAKPVTNLSKAVDRLNPFSSGKGAGIAGAVLDRGAGALGGYELDKQLGGSGKIGAIAGGLTGVSGMLGGKGVSQVINGGLKAVDWAAKGPVGAAVGNTANTAYQMALVNMSKGEAKPIVKQGNMEILQKVQAGQPAYAASFQALNNPAYRVAKETEDDDEKDDKEDNSDE